MPVMIPLRETAQADAIRFQIHTCQTVDDWCVFNQNCPTNTATPIHLGKMGEFFERLETSRNNKLFGKLKSGSNVCSQLLAETVHRWHFQKSIDFFTILELSDFRHGSLCLSRFHSPCWVVRYVGKAVSLITVILAWLSHF
jgi:hypothetical protein